MQVIVHNKFQSLQAAHFLDSYIFNFTLQDLSISIFVFPLFDG